MNNSTHMVSVIVPVYNVEKYLDECIRSIIVQTYPDIEIILIDDGSTDISPYLCDKWEKANKRIKVIHQENGGLSDARNTGLNAASGKYIMFVDSDDFIEPMMIEDLMDLISATNADVACGNVWRYKADKTRIPFHDKHCFGYSATITGLEQLKHMLCNHINCGVWGKLYTRSIIGGHRFIKGRYNEDVIFLTPLYASARVIAYSHRFYYNYRVTAGSITSSLSERTMHALTNALEMKEMVRINKWPVENEMRNYMYRTCLELGYAVQRDRASKRFQTERDFIMNHLIRDISYPMWHKDYSIRDLIHLAIVLCRL